ncbi:THO complex subunit 4B [Capsicum chinense]|nr:THO complex subunit 4B [Capsicum chinense]
MRVLLVKTLTGIIRRWSPPEEQGDEIASQEPAWRIGATDRNLDGTSLDSPTRYSPSPSNPWRYLSLDPFITWIVVHISFAIADNLGEVSAKGQIQTVCFDNLGLTLVVTLNILSANNPKAVKSGNPDYTHFVSLPLLLHSETVKKLNNFQKSVLRTTKVNQDEDSYLYISFLYLGIEKSMFINPKIFHLTVLMLKLSNNDQIKAAAKRIGFIGLENMRPRMADSLIKARYEVALHDIHAILKYLACAVPGIADHCDKLMTLDDLIKKIKTAAGGKHRGRGRAVAAATSDGGPSRRFPNRSANRAAPYSTAKLMMVVQAPEAAWNHNMFGADQAIPFGQGGGRASSSIETGTKLYISNLDYGVYNEDIKETSEVVFSRRQDAIAGVKRLNNVQPDGKPMKIEIVGTNIVTPTAPFPGGAFGFEDTNGVPRRVKTTKARLDELTCQIKLELCSFSSDFNELKPLYSIMVVMRMCKRLKEVNLVTFEAANDLQWMMEEGASSTGDKGQNRAKLCQVVTPSALHSRA